MNNFQNTNVKIHPLSDVQTKSIGKGSVIWQFSVVLAGCIIGENCNINCHTFIENEVSIGNNVTIKSGVHVWDGVTIEDDVFIGPSVVFTNDLNPRSKQRVEYLKTIIKGGASVGANTTILAGVTVGAYSLTGIASVVTRDVPDHALVYGTPAKVQGWVDESGDKLLQIDESIWRSDNGILYEICSTGLKRK